MDILFAVTQQFLNSAHMTEAGPLEALSGEESDDEKELRTIKLPGVRKGQWGKRGAGSPSSPQKGDKCVCACVYFIIDAVSRQMYTLCVVY